MEAPQSAPVVAPAPPEKLPEVAAQPPPPAAPPHPPLETSKPAAALQVVEPQVPRSVKPAAPAARPAPPATRAQAPEPRPLLRKTGACEIKPVMSDQDLVNCGATPR